ncbi:hypothetical protein [Marinagarivorans algicola]|nr:hypothetical protein [Marinagarivorans algicola]
MNINAIEREQDGIVQKLQDFAAPMINSTDDFAVLGVSALVV